jgi:RHS repeat-associated protein
VGPRFRTPTSGVFFAVFKSRIWLAAFVLLLPLHAFASIQLSSVAITGQIVGGSDSLGTATVSLSRGTDPNDQNAVSCTLYGPGLAFLKNGAQISSFLVAAGVSTETFQMRATNVVASPQNAFVTVTCQNAITQYFTIDPFSISLSATASLTGNSMDVGAGSVTLTPSAGPSGVSVFLGPDFGDFVFINGAGQQSSLLSFGPGESTKGFTFYARYQVSTATTSNLTAKAGVTQSTPVQILPFQLSLSGPNVMFNTDKGDLHVTIDKPARNSVSVSFSQTPGGLNSLGGVVIPSAASTASYTVTALQSGSPLDDVVKATTTGASATTTIRIMPGKTPDTNCSDCEGEGGKPINFTTGNTWITHRDYSLPGLGGGIELERTWNSLWPQMSPIETSGHFGYSWRSTYEERLQTVSGGYTKYWLADGSNWNFRYDSVNAVYYLVTPADAFAALTFDSLTNTRTITFKDGSQKIFNSGGYLTKRIDHNGNTTTVAYDASNRITSVTNAANRMLTFNYTGSSRLVTSIQDSTGVIATYTYGASSTLTRVTYADGSQLNYDQNNAQTLITAVADKDGKLLEGHTYDGNSRGLTSFGANNADKITIAYTSGTLTQVTDSKGNTTDYTFSSYSNGHRKMNAVSGPGCNSCGGRGVKNFGHDGFGNRTSVTESGQTVASAFDNNGNLVTRTVYLNGTPLTTTYTYNAFGQVLTATDPAGNVTTNTYDTHGNLLTTTTPSPSSGVAGSTTTFEYFPNGLLKKVTDPRNNATQMTYTAAGLVQTITDAQSNVTTFEYDARGNRTAVVDAANNRTTFEYDALNRLTKVTKPDTTHTDFAYDTRGRRTSVTDANGKVTTYAYDDADRLISVTDAQTPSAGVTTYAYDTENNLTSITDALGRTTTFEYDARGRVTKTIFPASSGSGAGLSETYNYDNLGNLLSKVDRKGQTITYGYDSLNRLTSKTLGSTGSVTYTYDNLGRLTQAEDATGTYGLAYDNLGRLTQTTTEYSFLPSQTFTMSYGYDAASNRTSFTDPQSGVTNYVYDTLNRLESLTNPQSQQFTFGYDNLSRRTSLGRPNGVTTSYTYDNLSRLLSVLHKDPAQQVIDGATYTVDSVGNRLSKQNHLAGVTDSYTYDPIYQLTQATRAAATMEFYDYDKVGNRTSSHLSASYTTNSSNQLTATASATYTYDNNGNTISKTEGADVTQYTWDYENRLTQVTLPNSLVVTFKYDPFGRRIQKASAAGTINYLYDGANVVDELDASGTILARYTQGAGIDEPLAMLRSGMSSYYEADGLGSITSLTDTTGAIATSYQYDSYGKITTSTGTLVNPFRYTGREWVYETNEYYYRSRSYDQHVGRFVNEDPFEFAGRTSNFFRYVEGNPVNLRDPFGLYSGWEFLKDLGTFSEAFADTLTFGSASRLNDALGAGKAVDRCSWVNTAGTASGIAFSIAVGGALGAEAAEANAGKKGFEFSHWIPDSWGGPRSVFNGNYVSSRLHYLTDPFRYPAPKGAALRWGAKWNPVLKHAVRIPWVYDGAAAGAGLGAVGAGAGQNCGCN